MSTLTKRDDHVCNVETTHFSLEESYENTQNEILESAIYSEQTFIGIFPVSQS